VAPHQQIFKALIKFDSALQLPNAIQLSNIVSKAVSRLPFPVSGHCSSRRLSG